jgi:CRP-like cAMP-binding protein
VESGEVTLYKQMGLGERHIRTFRAGEHFGKMTLISEARRVATIKANNEFHCLVLDKKEFNTVLEDEP